MTAWLMYMYSIWYFSWKIFAEQCPARTISTSAVYPKVHSKCMCFLLGVILHKHELEHCLPFPVTVPMLQSGTEFGNPPKTWFFKKLLLVKFTIKCCLLNIQGEHQSTGSHTSLACRGPSLCEKGEREEKHISAEKKNTAFQRWRFLPFIFGAGVTRGFDLCVLF